MELEETGGDVPKDPLAPWTVEYHSLLVQHLGHIDRVVGGMARRHQLSAPDTEELTSVVRYKLIDKDFAILKKFQGRSSIATYLTVVVERLCLDFFNERWGKWRPSSTALKSGATAIQLEQLAARDGLTFDEAVNTLQINQGVAESREELLAIFVQLPVHAIKRLAGEEELALVAARGGASDPAFDLPEEYALAARIESVLTGGIAALGARDRLLIKLHYLDALSVASIARMLDVEARPLYNHLEDIKRQLRGHLRKAGVDEVQVNRIVGHSAVTLGRIFRDGDDARPENGGLPPSKEWMQTRSRVQGLTTGSPEEAAGPTSEALAAYIDRGVEAEERAQLEAHPADCDDCRRLIAHVLESDDGTDDEQVGKGRLLA